MRSLVSGHTSNNALWASRSGWGQGRRGRLVSAMVSGLCAMLLVSTSALVSPAVPVAAQPAGGGGGLLIWPDGNAFTTFGPNAVVSIGVAQIDFIGFGQCPDGIDDMIQPAADVYIMPSGGVPDIGGRLFDVRGSIHTIVGNPVVDEVIGTTAPGGTLAPGKYAVV